MSGMTKNITYLITVAFLLLTGCTSLKYGSRRIEAPDDAVRFKLANDVIPTKYELSLWASPRTDYFSGQVNIDISLLSERRDILLHAQDLEVMSVGLHGPQGDVEGEFSVINDDGLARIEFGQTLKEGHYRLEIAYRGKYGDDLSGLYRVKDGNEFYLYTQFEPLSARKMLPCFDEPRFKTPFDVKVISSKGQTVIANTSLKSSFSQNEEEIHIFNTTKPLPTYLLALAIGPFDVVEGPTLEHNRYRSDDISFRGIATKGKGEKLKFALKETPQILAKLEEYFSVAYPYEKLDILAVPDFSAGAMENAGAITFREGYLLMDEAKASVDQRRGFYLVTAHELAHQWFGNSVTMPWWDDLWLNEAFATWLSYKIIDQIKPQFKSATRLLELSHRAMAEDSLSSARKIREPILSTHDIHNAFDGITYWKGGAVLSMLENYLGENRFRDAVSSHIKRFEDKTSTSQDFLKSLAKFSDSSLVTSAETFLNQTGVPHVKVSYSCDQKGFKVKIEQSRYVPIGSKALAKGLWDIPMCISYDASGTMKKHCFTLDNQVTKIDIDAAQCPNFVMPNAQGQGYYRFSLNLEAWKNLLAAKPGLIGEGDRLAIADSLVAELYAGGVDFAFVIEGLRGLIDQNSAVLTSYFMNLIKEANNFWVDEKNRFQVLAYAHDALREIYHGLEETSDLSDDQILLKKELASFLAHVVKDKEIRLDLSVLGSAYLHHVSQEGDHESSLLEANDENLLNDAVAISLQFQDDPFLINLAEGLSEMTDTVKRGHLLYGLAKSREGDTANYIRSLVFNDNLRRMEQLRLFYDHLENPGNQPTTWEFLKSNISKLKKTLSKQQLANLPYLAQGLCDKGAAQEVNQFFAPFIADYQGGPRNLAEVTEQIELCSARKSHAASFANRFFEGMKDMAVAEQELSQ